MNLSLRQKTERMTKVHQPYFRKELLSERIYLLERSLDRYESLKKWGAPDVLLDAERSLFHSRLLALRMELKK